ncbi:hypothetical protein F4694_001096 [Bacillus niacini]|uniref:Uncharacterized protein n=1 Tax=Neobacillus niacini TaxID=86668 RepID=A0A852T6I0_9BACI|nr:hypothetical protein [Neobacillus niacini]
MIPQPKTTIGEEEVYVVYFRVFDDFYLLIFDFD